VVPLQVTTFFDSLAAKIEEIHIPRNSNDVD
jgi:hypothetical protein